MVSREETKEKLNDNNTNIQELKIIVQKFCDDRDWDKFHDAKELAIALSIEASELLEHFRFKSKNEIEEMFNNENKKQEISEEISDILYFLTRFAHKYDIDLTMEFHRKMEKNNIKYPIEKSKGSNKKYTEY